MRFRDKRAVVVSAASPIGQACVRRLIEDGAEIIAVDRDREALETLCGEIGACILSVVADQSTESGIESIVERCRVWELVDVLINCSGIIDFWTEDQATFDGWMEVFRGNVLGPAFLAKALLPQLAKSANGSVVFLGSIDGARGNPSLPAYSVSKGGLVPLTHLLADDWASSGIRVNCVETAFILHVGPGDPFPSHTFSDFETIKARTPLKRRATPEEVASAVLFLASSDSSYVTGHVLTIDGGRTAVTPGTARN